MSAKQLRLYIITVSIFIFLGITGGLLNIAWTYMQDTFNVQTSDIGILLLAATSGSLIAALSSGPIIGRFGMGRTVVTGALIVTVGLFAVALSGSWIAILVIIFVLFMGRGTLDAGLNNFVSLHYDSTAMNWLHASWGLGLTIAPAIITFIIVGQALSWQVAYALIGGVSLVILFTVFMHLRQWDDLTTDDDSEDEAQTPKARPAALLETLKYPPALLSMLIFFVYGGVEIGTGQLINTLFTESRMIEQELASLWLSFYWGSFTVGRFLVGFVALRFSDRAILTVSTMLAVVGGVLLIPAEIATLNAIGLICIGVGLAPIFPILISQTPQRVGKSHSANTIGLQVGIAGMGAAVLPGIIGVMTRTPIGLEAIAFGIFINTLLLLALYQWLVIRYPVVRVIRIVNRDVSAPEV